MKILNLYAGIGGNRMLWGSDHQITSVEIDPDIAFIYSHFYPDDEIIVGNAHEYLRENFEKFDFIWSSPPCQTHTRINATIVGNGCRPRYIDMKLYQEIVFLDNWFKGKYVVENVIPYYRPLIPAQKADRHLWWANFKIGNFAPTKKPPHMKATLGDLQDFFGIDLSSFKVRSANKNGKRQLLRNMVHPETGHYILQRAVESIQMNGLKQIGLFA